MMLVSSLCSIFFLTRKILGHRQDREYLSRRVHIGDNSLARYLCLQSRANRSSIIQSFPKTLHQNYPYEVVLKQGTLMHYKVHIKLHTFNMSGISSDSCIFLSVFYSCPLPLSDSSLDKEFTSLVYGAPRHLGFPPTTVRKFYLIFQAQSFGYYFIIVLKRIEPIPSRSRVL